MVITERCLHSEWAWCLSIGNFLKEVTHFNSSLPLILLTGKGEFWSKWRHIETSVLNAHMG